MQKPKHILVFRFSAMGDVAMTVPALLAVVRDNENVRLTVVTRAFFKPIFDDIPNTTVFTVDFKGKHKGVIGLFNLSRELLKLDFDAIADLHNVLRTKVLKLFLLSKKAITIDKGRREKKALVTGRVFEQLKHTTQRYAEVFQKLGLVVDLSKGLTLPRVELKAASSTFINKNDKLNIGIAPFAAHGGKMYPLELMEEVIERLTRDYNIILFGGGKEETKALTTIENKYKNTISVAGKLSFKDELALISNLDAMLSMDSGNGHLAAMYGVKVISIWGVTHPYAGFAPFNQPESYILTADRTKFPLIPTSVYGNKYPEDYENASASISPKQIIEVINKICPIGSV
jgi:ADP-heptose:LPS heptosyltransferase